MPLTHTRTLRVRYYECNPRGEVGSANYLRYMQEAAFDASAAVGYDMDRYEALGRLWLIRETAIEHLVALRYGDVVQIRTWVADFRRIRSRRDYELRNAESGVLAARAYSDWVYLDRASGRPAQIGPELVHAFSPGAEPETMPQRSRFPRAPEPPDGVFRLCRTVDRRDLDQVGHVNNAVYLEYMEDCAGQAMSAYGWTEERLASLPVELVARGHRIEYRQPALFGEELELASWLSEVGRSSMVRHYTVTRVRNGEMLAQARTHLAVTDGQLGRELQLPASFVRDLSRNISPCCS